jgi:hypothetical protein
LIGYHRCTAWLAIVALLVDGLLPTALAAETRFAAAPPALCGAAAGAPQPARQAPPLPARHCALCLASLTALLPGRPASPATRPLPGTSLPSAALCAAASRDNPNYATAQPRAPPRAAS